MKTHSLSTTPAAFAAILSKLEPGQPLAGALIACTLPRTAVTDMLVEALQKLGAVVRVPAGDAMHDLLDWPNQTGPNLLLEHGAALSRLIHAGTRAEGRDGVPEGRARPYSAIATAILGTTEITPDGARWLARRAAGDELLYPAMDCACSGPFAALSLDDRGMRASAALSLMLLSQVDLFRGTPRAAELHGPASALTRAISVAHDDLLRSRIEKIRPAGAEGPPADALDAAAP